MDQSEGADRSPEVDRSLGADRSSMTYWILYGEDRLCGVDQSSCSVADRSQV